MENTWKEIQKVLDLEEAKHIDKVSSRSWKIQNKYSKNRELEMQQGCIVS